MKRNKHNTKLINSIIKHYLKYDSDNPFIFISTLLAFFGIAAGVMVLILSMAIMNGTQNEFRKKLFVMNYPITIMSAFDNKLDNNALHLLEQKFQKLHFSPFLSTQAITKSSSSVNGVMLYGVDFAKEARINEVFAKSLTQNTDANISFPLITGDILCEAMGVLPGDKITLFFSNQQAIGFGTMPLQKRFQIFSTFNSGLKAYDKSMAYTTLEAYQKIHNISIDEYDGIHVYSDNAMNDLDNIKLFLIDNGYKDKFFIEGWWQQNKSFFAAMEMEKNALFLVLLLIILVASLNIISSLLMTVMSRRTEIALLRTLGATSVEIREIFFKLGMIIGISGTVIGSLLGFVGMWLLDKYPIIELDESVYGFSKLPLDLKMLDFGLIILGAIVIVLISSLYPAKKASTTDPLKVLRNE